jgi:hypothetical protein
LFLQCCCQRCTCRIRRTGRQRAVPHHASSWPRTRKGI